MKNKIFLYLCALFLLAKTDGMRAQCSVICNGDFENTIYASPSIDAFVTDNLVDCWRTDAADHQIEFWYSGYGSVPAYSGNQFIELNSNYASTVFQNFTAVPGTVLSLGFAHRGRAGVDQVRVKIGPVGGPYTIIGTYSDGNTAWGHYTANYTVPSGVGTMFTLEFISYTYAGGNPAIGNFIDDVTLTAPSTVPVFATSTTITQAGCTTPNFAQVIGTTPNLSYTYLWSPGGYTSPSISNVPAGVYNVTVTAANSCTSATTVVQITLNPTPPTPTVSIVASPTLHCAGHSVTLAASGASNYTWQPGGATTGTIVVSPTVGTTYTVTGANAYGCTSTATYYVGPPLPNPTLGITSSPPVRCYGTSAVLTATGASSYVWQPGSFSGNPYTVNPTVATNYTVTGTVANGCTATAVYNLPAPFPNPTVNVTASSTIACPGYASTLTASGADTYYWYPLGGTSYTAAVTPTTTTTYYVFGNNSTTGCQGFATVTIASGSVIDLSTTNVTLCTNSATSIPITVSSTFNSGPVTFYWQPANQYGQTINVSPASPTIYTVTATSNAGCPNSATLAVAVTTNCCSQSTTGLVSLSGLGSTYSGNSYFLANSVTLSSSTIFQNSEVLMMPGVQITVPPGKVLDLQGAHLYACGINMWQGIVIQDGGQIITTTANGNEGSMIEDAVIAIKVDNITPAHAAPPVMIDNVVFNKNYIGIQLSNSSGISSLPVGVSECVFSSKTMPFSSSSWPTTYNTGSGLRAPYSPVATQDIFVPYTMLGYAQSNLKLPYASQPAHIGIEVYKVGGSLPNTGVDIGVTYPIGNNKFNLFDGLDIGIDITDGSFATYNNVFQNSGTGINHNITQVMTTALNLMPTTPSTNYANNFWNCGTGIFASNVSKVNMSYGVFRSDNHAYAHTGIQLSSDRFNYDIEQCQFNSLDKGIVINANTGPDGTNASNILIKQNYFGPEVNSTNPMNAEYLNFAVTVDGSVSGNWHIGGNCQIIGNKLDRVFRGIRVNDLNTYPVEIGGNDIYVLDDNLINPSSQQYGIFAYNSLDNMFINENNVRGNGTNNPETWNQRLKLIRSSKNQATITGISPIITCNNTYDAYVGFEFDGPQPNTVWTGNGMYQKMKMGLELINNGQIGTQGSSGQSCNDIWDNNGNTPPFVWGAGSWQTFVDVPGQAAPYSFLWCDASSPIAWPVFNGGGMPFSQPASIDAVSPDGVQPGCAYPTVYPDIPTQRTMGTTTGLSELNNTLGIEVFPNPTKGLVSIKSTLQSETLAVRIMDVTGKVVYNGVVNAASNSIDLSQLKTALYFVEVQSNNSIVRKKIIKE